MCLGIPGRIMEITGDVAVVDVAGARRSASLMLLPCARVGEYVIVHAGFAMARLDEDEAAETLRIIDDIIARKKGGP